MGRVMKEEKQLLNWSPERRELFRIKDALFDIKLRVSHVDKELARDLEVQMDRLLRLAYKS